MKKKILSDNITITMWKNRREREIWTTAIFNFVKAMKYDRSMYAELADMIQTPIVGKVKRRIKTVQHYLIHDQEGKAREQLYQFMDEIENVSKTNTK